MKLTHLDRMAIGGLLPQSGRGLRMIVAANIRRMARLTPEEETQIDYVEIKLPDGRSRVEFNVSKAADVTADREFDFTVQQHAMIQEALEARDRKSEITEAHIGLIELFNPNLLAVDDKPAAEDTPEE